MMIKKIINILLLFIIVMNIGISLSSAQEGYIEYNIYGYKFSPGDEDLFLKQGNKNLKLYELAKTETEKKFYLQEAMRYYFMVHKINKDSINAHIGLGQVYDAMNQDIYAKEHFFQAYNINLNNPELNLKFGDYYFKRKSYITALSHYKIAYYNGYSRNAYLNLKMGIIYEKLADIEKSRQFYLNAVGLDSANKNLIKKIHSLDDLNYSETQYYLFMKN